MGRPAPRAARPAGRPRGATRHGRHEAWEDAHSAAGTEALRVHHRRCLDRSFGRPVRAGIRRTPAVRRRQADADAHPGSRRSRPAGADRVAGHAPALDLRPGPKTPARGHQERPRGQVPGREGARRPQRHRHRRGALGRPHRRPRDQARVRRRRRCRAHSGPHRGGLPGCRDEHGACHHRLTGPLRWPPRRTRPRARIRRESPTSRAATGSSSPTGRSTRCRSSRARTSSSPRVRAC